MVIRWFHLCCVSNGGKYCNDVNPEWGYQLHSGISPVKQPEWTSTHRHTTMDGWVCGPDTLFHWVLAPQLTSIDLKRFYKCAEFGVHPTNWVVSHFVCPLNVSYLEEGPEIKKQIEALMQIGKMMCAGNLEYARARWHCQQNGMDPKGFVETRDRTLNQQTSHNSYIPFAFNRGCLSTAGKIHNIFSSWSAVWLLAD